MNLHILPPASSQHKSIPSNSASNYLQKIVTGKIPAPFSHYFYLDILQLFPEAVQDSKFLMLPFLRGR
jgi:hypothetical protein